MAAGTCTVMWGAPPRIDIIRFPLIILFERWGIIFKVTVRWGIIFKVTVRCGIIFKVTVSVNSSVHPEKLCLINYELDIIVYNFEN